MHARVALTFGFCIAGCASPPAATAPHTARCSRACDVDQAPPPPTTTTVEPPPTTSFGPLQPTFDPVATTADAALPSAAFTGAFVRNDLDRAWRLGAPTRESIAPLVEHDQLTARQADLLLALPAKVRAMGMEPKHCRLDGGTTLACFEPAGATRCEDRIRTVTLRIRDAAIEVAHDEVVRERIDRADGSCGCYG